MMKNKIEKVFKNNKTALIPYICAGDPDIETTKKIIYKLDEKGASIIELGIPFSDPLADGPVIQSAGQRALKKGVNLKKILNMAAEIKGNIKSPLILMGYYNSILAYGKDKFIKDINNAGISGIIIPDLPYDQDRSFYKLVRENNLAGILLVAPNTDEKRLKYLGNKSEGFLYCVSVLGITGEKKDPSQYLDRYLTRVKRYSKVPTAVGFGIDNPDKAKIISKYTDGVIIGSAIIKIINKYSDNKGKMLKKVGNFIENIFKELD